MKKVMTTRNVYTGKVMNLCQTHRDANENGTDQVSRGLHAGLCDVCEGRERIQDSSYVSREPIQHRADDCDAAQARV